MDASCEAVLAELRAIRVLTGANAQLLCFLATHAGLSREAAKSFDDLLRITTHATDETIAVMRERFKVEEADLGHN